jgi:phosphosulfolactate phosphohydrolase-like enzyme
MASQSRRVVQIDALAESVSRHVDGAIVCIDVFLSTTTVTTSIGQGRRTLVAATAAGARAYARGLTNPILAGEPGLLGTDGFDQEAGPADLEERQDVARPLVLAAPAAELLHNARGASAVYVACLRNMSATAELLARTHERVILVGAGHGSDVRYEDQIAAAWIGHRLVKLGFEPVDHLTAREIDRWSSADVSLVALSRGAEYLRRAGRARDLEFALTHVDDMEISCRFQGGEMRGVPSSVHSAVG